MKKVIMVLLSICVLADGRDWQGEQTVAIYMAGQEPKGALGSHKTIGSELVKMIRKDGRFGVDNITNDLKKQYSNQRGIVVSNELVKYVKLQFSSQYLCMVEISEVTSNIFRLDVRLMDVVTDKIIKTSTVSSNLSNTDERESVARKIALELINVLGNIPMGVLGDVPADVQPEFAGTYTLTVNANPAHLLDTSRTTWDAGTQVDVPVTTIPGYTFTGWSGASLSASNPITITMNRDLTLTANYQKQQIAPEYHLTVNVYPEYGGSVSRSPNYDTYTVGEQVTVTAIPYRGYTFSHWSGASSSTSNRTTITMHRDRTLIAYFKKHEYTLTVDANPTYGGRVSYRPYKYLYASGEHVTITAVPYSGYTFSRWAGTLSSTNNPINTTINRDLTLIANFQEQRGMGLGIGVFSPFNFGGGIKWDNGEVVAMPYCGMGGYLFFDAIYVEAFIGAGYFGGYWESAGALNQRNLPDMQRSYINAGVFMKYPIGEDFKLFPLIGIDYEASIFGKLKYDNGSEYMFDGENEHPQASDLSVWWFKFGVGCDLSFGDNVYLRYELLYGFRTANVYEEKYAAKNYNAGISWNTRSGHGLIGKLGLGFILF